MINSDFIYLVRNNDIYYKINYVTGNIWKAHGIVLSNGKNITASIYIYLTANGTRITSSNIISNTRITNDGTDTTHTIAGGGKRKTRKQKDKK